MLLGGLSPKASQLAYCHPVPRPPSSVQVIPKASNVAERMKVPDPLVARTHDPPPWLDPCQAPGHASTE